MDGLAAWAVPDADAPLRQALLERPLSSTVWTSGIAGDFDYRNNVVDGPKPWGPAVEQRLEHTTSLPFLRDG